MPGSAATVSRNAALGTATTARFASATGAASIVVAAIPVEIDVRQVARVAARRGDRRDLFRITAGERHVVAAVAKDDRERRAPGAAADHGYAHGYSLFTKSIETGTPSSSNRLRSSFSTQ